ncbi:MAG: hypothetical protein MI919_14800 [Holophagales bacterium]|nr:hypothetical protein [Holophagales bacterium]
MGAVEVRASGWIDPSLDIREWVELRPGDPLTDDAVRRTLAACHATGLFAKAELHVTPGTGAGDPVTVVLVLEGQERVGQVRFEGQLGVSRRHLRRHLRQQGDGAILDGSAVLDTVFALQDALRERGYLDAEVRVEVQPTPRQHVSDLVVTIQAGSRARLSSVTLETAPSRAAGGLSPEGTPANAELMRAIRARPGDLLDPGRLEDDRSRLVETLREMGYYAASVEPPRIDELDSGSDDSGSDDSDREPPVVDVVFPVAVGPRYELVVTGAELDQLERLGFLPFLDDRAFDPSRFEQSCLDIREHYQGRGHYRAEVDCRIGHPSDGGAADNAQRLEIAIRPGPLLELAEVLFEGNERVSDSSLRPLLGSQPQRAGGGVDYLDARARELLSQLEIVPAVFP